MVFWGPISEEKLKNVFTMRDPFFLSLVRALLGIEFLVSKFCFCTNMDISSLFCAWGLHFSSQAEVRREVQRCVRPEWRVGLEEILACAMLR